MAFLSLYLRREPLGWVSESVDGGSMPILCHVAVPRRVRCSGGRADGRARGGCTRWRRRRGWGRKRSRGVLNTVVRRCWAWSSGFRERKMVKFVVGIVCRGMAWLKMEVPREGEGKLVKERKCQDPFPQDGNPRFSGERGPSHPVFLRQDFSCSPESWTMTAPRYYKIMGDPP
jgi:hypothetical protein